MVAALDIAQKIQKGEIANDSEGFKPIDMKKEAAGILFRTSQKIWKIKENPGKDVQGVECLKLRLEHRTDKYLWNRQHSYDKSKRPPNR